MEEKDLLEIIGKLRAAGREFKTIDAKQELKLQENGEKAEFVKDVVAMANNGEKSYLVIGIQDGTFADIGRLRRHLLKNDLNQFLADKIDPPVVVDYNEFSINGNEYGLIEIIGYNPPYIVARDLVAERTDRKQIRIYKGTIFVRHEDRTEGISRTELEELLKARGVKKEFEKETEYAQQLVFERPFGWEYLLTAELLRSKLVPIKRRFAELQRGLIYKKSISIQGVDFMKWVSAKCRDLAHLVQITAKIMNEELPKSWGPPGVPGEPLEIKQVIDRLISVCEELVEWETDIRYIVPPNPLLSLKQKMEGWTAEFLDEVDSAPEKLTEPFKQPNPTGRYIIKLVIKAPSGLDEAMAEIQRIQSHPELYRGL